MTGLAASAKPSSGLSEVCMVRTGLLFVFLSLCLAGLWLGPAASADKAKPRLLDGELVEEGQSLAPAPQPAAVPVMALTATLQKEFTITLPVVPATGLVWRLAQYDRRCLQLLRHRYQRPDRTQPGAAGRQQFDFLPLQSGRTTLTFVAQPPLVATVAHQQLVTVTIK